MASALDQRNHHARNQHGQHGQQLPVESGLSGKAFPGAKQVQFCKYRSQSARNPKKQEKEDQQRPACPQAFFAYEYPLEPARGLLRLRCLQTGRPGFLDRRIGGQGLPLCRLRVWAP